MVPDFAYFLPLPVNRAQSHSLLGLIWFCLPLGIVSYFAFHLLVAPLAYILLPLSIRGRLPSNCASGTVSNSPVSAVVVSLVVGAATHLVWDSFTHPTSVVVDAIPSIATPLFTWEGYTVFVYKVLQHGSTLLGLGLLFWWGILWVRKSSPAEPKAVLAARSRVLLLAVLLGPPFAIGLASGWGSLDAGVGILRQLQLFVGSAVFSGGSVFLIWVLVVGTVWRIICLSSGHVAQ